MSRPSLTTRFRTDWFPYHEDYGLPDSLRMKAVEESYVLSVARSAKNNGVSPASIYNWRRDCRIEIKTGNI
jgi:hypothetical protein